MRHVTSGSRFRTHSKHGLHEKVTRFSDRAIISTERKADTKNRVRKKVNALSPADSISLFKTGLSREREHSFQLEKNFKHSCRRNDAHLETQRPSSCAWTVPPSVDSWADAQRPLAGQRRLQSPFICRETQWPLEGFTSYVYVYVHVLRDVC